MRHVLEILKSVATPASVAVDRLPIAYSQSLNPGTQSMFRNHPYWPYNTLTRRSLALHALHGHMQRWSGSIKATLPDAATLPLGPLNITAISSSSGATSVTLLVNVPIIDWRQTDAWRDPGVVYPGGELRLFGKALAFSASPSTSSGLECLPLPPLFSASPQLLPAPNLAAALVPVGGSVGASVPLSIIGSPSCYQLSARLPTTGVADGEYTLALNNGLLAAGAFESLALQSVVVVVNASSAPRWPTRLFTVGVDCAATRIGNCLDAAEKAGGGTVGVPPGFYRMPQLTMLGLGNNVTLTGLSGDAGDTTLAWMDEAQNGSQCVSNNSYYCACVFTKNQYWDPTAKTSGALRNLTVLVTSPVRQAVQLVNCVGCEITNVVINLTFSLAEFPLANAGWGPLWLNHAEQWRVSNVTIVAGHG
jgi:hypothetical protein